MEYHWADLIATKAIAEKQGKQIIATGTSLSGEPHIGNANDVIRGYAVYNAIISKGAQADLIWIADDMDPLRSIPIHFPKELYNYLAFPVASVPDPYGCHRSFVHHYEEVFLADMKRMGINLIPYFGVDLYKEGKYDGTKLIALEKREEIRQILMRVTGADLPPTWYPIDAICPKCGRLATTKVIEYYPDKKTVLIECSEKEILLNKKNPVKGCGYKGEVSVLNGNTKLTWRVEWPARWSFLNVTVEPFGKEHAAAGGSYATGKEIVKLFGWDPPIPVEYEHYQMGGEKMSKSKGNIVTVAEFLNLISPEELKFYMYFERIEKARNIDLTTLPPFIADEFDRSERIYSGEEECRDEKEKVKRTRSYELSNEKLVKHPQVPFQFCSVLTQLFPEDKILTLLQKSGFLPSQLNDLDAQYVSSRMKRAKYWVDNYAPEEKKIKLNETSTITASDAEKQLFKKIADSLRAKDVWNGEDLQTSIFQMIRESGVPPKQVFSQLYQLFISRNEGPKIGPFISFMDRNYVLSMLEKAAM